MSARTPYRTASGAANPGVDISFAGSIFRGVELRTERWGAAACRQPDGVIAVAYAALPPCDDGGARSWPFIRVCVRQLRWWGSGVSFGGWSTDVYETGSPEDAPEATPARRDRLETGPGAFPAKQIFGFVMLCLALSLVGHACIALLSVATTLDLDPASGAAQGAIAAARLLAMAAYMRLLRRFGDIVDVYRNSTAAQKVLNAHVRLVPVTLVDVRCVSAMSPYASANLFAWMFVIWAGFTWAGSTSLTSLGLDARGHVASLGVELATLPLGFAAASELQRIAWRLFRSGHLLGLWRVLGTLQAVTVVEPSDEQLEVALVAYRELLELEAAAAHG